MGKAARWLKALLTGRKPPPDDRKPAKEKKKWGFGKSDRERRPEVVVGMEERKGPYREVGCVSAEEENKRAIAMAAATAAVAEAAVAAAQAAAVVVRLTSSGRGVVGVKREQLAAVKIQAAFRGYLARRALKALKGLVKLQALVRGNIVRKQAAETLRCMQALVRVQARARACRALRSEKGQKLHSKGSSGAHSLPGPPTPEKFEPPIRQSSSSGSVKKNSNPANSEKVEQDKMQYAPWNWLDRWMEERYWDSREAIAKSTAIAMTEDDRSTKILEIDTGRQHHHHNAKRRSSYQPHSSCSTLTSEQNTCSISNLPASPSRDSTAAHLSIPSPPSVDMQQSLSPLRFHPVEAGDYGDSPQFYSAKSRHGSSRRGPFTPAKSECSRSLFSGYFDYPNYMAGTESSRAKARSQSAPKQRQEFEKSGSMKRLSAIHQGFMQQNSSVSTQKSLSLQAKFANKAYPGSGRLDRLGMPMRM